MIDHCVSYLEDDVPSLIAAGFSSYALRQIISRYLFRHLVFRARVRRSLQDYIAMLDDLGDNRRFVKTFTLTSGLYWGNPRLTQVSICDARALMDHFPRLEVLDLECFTWRKCNRAHECLAGMIPRPLTKLTLAHMRIRGNADPLEVTRCISSLKSLTLFDTLPTDVVHPVHPTALKKLSLQSASIQILMDCRTQRSSFLHFPSFPPYYDTHSLCHTTFLNCKTLKRLQLTWTLSHSFRGTLSYCL